MELATLGTAMSAADGGLVLAGLLGLAAVYWLLNNIARCAY